MTEQNSTTETQPIRLKWGSPGVIPEGATGAWGARMIVTQHGHVDMLHDRQDVSGPDYQKLLDRLNDGLLRTATDTVSDLLESYTMETRVYEDFILHMDDEVTIHANTNASAGYCYVTAWLVSK